MCVRMYDVRQGPYRCDAKGVEAAGEVHAEHVVRPRRHRAQLAQGLHLEADAPQVDDDAPLARALRHQEHAADPARAAPALPCALRAQAGQFLRHERALLGSS